MDTEPFVFLRLRALAPSDKPHLRPFFNSLFPIDYEAALFDELYHPDHFSALVLDSFPLSHSPGSGRGASGRPPRDSLACVRAVTVAAAALGGMAPVMARALPNTARARARACACDGASIQAESDGGSEFDPWTRHWHVVCSRSTAAAVTAAAAPSCDHSSDERARATEQPAPVLLLECHGACITLALANRWLDFDGDWYVQLQERLTFGDVVLDSDFERSCCQHEPAAASGALPPLAGIVLAQTFFAGRRLPVRPPRIPLTRAVPLGCKWTPGETEKRPDAGEESEGWSGLTLMFPGYAPLQSLLEPLTKADAQALGTRVEADGDPEGYKGLFHAYSWLSNSAAVSTPSLQARPTPPAPSLWSSFSSAVSRSFARAASGLVSLLSLPSHPSPAPKGPCDVHLCSFGIATELQGRGLGGLLLALTYGGKHPGPENDSNEGGGLTLEQLLRSGSANPGLLPALRGVTVSRWAETEADVAGRMARAALRGEGNSTFPQGSVADVELLLSTRTTGAPLGLVWALRQHALAWRQTPLWRPLPGSSTYSRLLQPQWPAAPTLTTPPPAPLHARKPASSLALPKQSSSPSRPSTQPFSVVSSLHTGSGNVRGQALYRRYGFSREARKAGFYTFDDGASNGEGDDVVGKEVKPRAHGHPAGGQVRRRRGADEGEGEGAGADENGDGDQSEEGSGRRKGGWIMDALWMEKGLWVFPEEPLS